MLVECKSCKHKVSKTAKICPNCGEKKPAKKSNAIYWIILIVMMLYIPQILSESSNNAVNYNTNNHNYIDKNTIIQKLELDFEWSLAGYDTVMQADFIIKNKSAYDIKDLVIKCDGYSNSGTLIDSNKKTIYEIVKSGKTRSVKNINVGFIHSQAKKVSCNIIDFSVMNSIH